jgi:hypothetical protein
MKGAKAGKCQNNGLSIAACEHPALGTLERLIEA